MRMMCTVHVTKPQAMKIEFRNNRPANLIHIVNRKLFSHLRTLLYLYFMLRSIFLCTIFNFSIVIFIGSLS